MWLIKIDVYSRWSNYTNLLCCEAVLKTPLIKLICHFKVTVQANPVAVALKKKKKNWPCPTNMLIPIWDMIHSNNPKMPNEMMTRLFHVMTANKLKICWKLYFSHLFYVTFYIMLETCEQNVMLATDISKFPCIRFLSKMGECFPIQHLTTL